VCRERVSEQECVRTRDQTVGERVSVRVLGVTDQRMANVACGSERNNAQTRSLVG
jgi:hypothetical protein